MPVFTGMTFLSDTRQLAAGYFIFVILAYAGIHGFRVTHGMTVDLFPEACSLTSRFVVTLALRFNVGLSYNVFNATNSL